MSLMFFMLGHSELNNSMLQLYHRDRSAWGASHRDLGDRSAWGAPHRDPGDRIKSASHRDKIRVPSLETSRSLSERTPGRVPMSGA